MMAPVCLFLLLLAVAPIPSDCQGMKSGILSVENVTRHASEIIAKANENITHLLIHGDIKPSAKRNAVPCTAYGCKWPKSGSYVYIPIVIGSEFTQQERNTIITGLVSFHQSTCIRFYWRSNEQDYLSFFSGTGCWSYLGRQGQGQLISLQKNSCVYLNTVQHEVLHALGFHHEHVRSDRDSYVNVYMQNVQPGYESNFQMVQTNNLGTPYDYTSVMQYDSYAFSKNGQPTVTAKNNPSFPLGQSVQMSCVDIDRVNRLYQCCKGKHKRHFTLL